MALSPEAVADRRRLTRKLLLWRTVAAGAAALAIVALSGAVGLDEWLDGGGDYVATLDVTGVIVSDQERRDSLANVLEDDSAKALIIRIDSPGGTFVGSDDLHKRLREVAEAKPVVAVINDVAASGGYMAAVAGDHILASRGSITASIGVIFQAPRVSRLMDSVGVDMDVWRSGDLKARPSPFEETPTTARAQTQEMVDRLFTMFLEMVRERRDLDPTALAVVRDGRVVTGQRALELGLIDALGGESDARAWLASEKDISEDLPERDVTPPPPIKRDGVLGRAMAFVLGERAAASGALGLTGLLALWTPLASPDTLR